MNTNNIVPTHTSLPPCIKKVDPFFYLHFQISYIKFTTKTLLSYENIDARVVWWGEEGRGTIFTPRCVNLAGYKQSVKTHAIYKVCVPLHHFTTYLSDMDKLYIDVIDKSKQSVIGRAFVEDIKQLGCNKTMRSLCSVYNEGHAKIGELLVVMSIEPGTASATVDYDETKINVSVIKEDAVKRKILLEDKQPVVSKIPEVNESADQSKQIIDNLIEKGKRLRETIAINVKDDEINDEIARRTFPQLGKKSDDEWLKGVLAGQSGNYGSLNELSNIHTESILKSSPIIDRRHVKEGLNNDTEALRLLTVNDSYFSESDGDIGRYKYLGGSDENIIAIDRQLSSDDDPCKRDSLIEELFYKHHTKENNDGKDGTLKTRDIKNVRAEENSKNCGSLKSDFEIYKNLSQNHKNGNISPILVKDRNKFENVTSSFNDDDDDDEDNPNVEMSANVIDSNWYRQISSIKVYLDMLWLNPHTQSPSNKSARSRSQSPNCSSDREKFRRSQDSASSFNNSSVATSISKPPVSRSIQWNSACKYSIDYKFPACVPDVGGPEKENLSAPRCPTRVPVRTTGTNSNSSGVRVFELNYASEFPVSFNNATIGKWCKGVVKFRLVAQDGGGKEAVVAVAVLPLRNLISTDNFYRLIPLRLPRNKINKARVVVGSLAIRTTMSVAASSTGPVQIHRPIDTDRRQRQYQLPRSVSLQQRNHSQRPLHSQQERVDPPVLRPNHGISAPRMPPISLVSLLSVTSVRYINTKMASGDYRSGIKSYNLYFIGRLLWAPEQKIKSRTLWGSSKLTDSESVVDLENFKLSEKVPLILTNELIERLKNNFAVLEVWDKSADGGRDSLYGLVKIPMNVLCMSFLNDHIRKTVLANVYPVMCCDDWVNIEDTISGKSKGQIHVTLALGSHQQIDNLLLSKENTVDGHWNRSVVATGAIYADLVEHSIEISIESLRNLDLNILPDSSNKDSFCYVQYYFPQQPSITEVNSRTWTTSTFRSVSHPIQANVDIADTNKHRFRLPIDSSLKAALNTHFEVVGKKHFLFEVYVKQYSPFPVSKSIAKGRLQVTSLFQLINQHSVSVDSMADTLTQQQMPIRLSSSDESQITDSIGTLNICVCYRTRLLEKSSGNVSSSSIPSPFDQPIVKIEILSATGLQKAAEMLMRIHPELEYSSVTGVNSHTKYWLTDEGNKQSRINVNSKGFQKFKVHRSKTVARSFTPKYDSVSEALLGPIIDDRDSNALCPTLAEKILTGVYQLNVEVYHDVPKSIYCDFNEDPSATSSILICKGRISLADLLLRSSGVMGPIWLTLFSPMDLDPTYSGCKLNLNRKRNSDSLYSIEKRKAVGAVEIRLSFNDKSDRRNALQLAMDAGYIVPWTSRLETEDLLWQTMDVHGCGFKYITVTVEEVELSSRLVSCVFSPEAGFKQSAMKVVTRYRLYKQSIASSPYFMLNQEELMERIFIPVNHRQQYCYKVSGDLFKYLRESKLEVQVWAIYGSSFTGVSDHEDDDHQRQDCPNDVRLLGGALFDLSSLILPSDTSHKTVSHILPLWKRGVANCDSSNVSVTVDICGATSPLSDYTSDNEDRGEHNPGRSVATGYDGKPTKGRNGSQKSFPAHVIIEKAMNLTRVEGPDPSVSGGKPLHYLVTLPCHGDPATVQSPVVKGTKEVAWNYEVDTRLPWSLLSGADGASLDLRLYCSWADSDIVEEICDEKVLVGVVRLDLSLLLRGFERVIGWYNVLDMQGDCRGQMKVGVTPLVPLVARSAAVAVARREVPAVEAVPFTLEQHQDYLASMRLRLRGDPNPLPIPSAFVPQIGNQQQQADAQEALSKSVLYSTLREKLKALDDITEVFKQRDPIAEAGPVCGGRGYNNNAMEDGPHDLQRRGTDIDCEGGVRESWSCDSRADCGGELTENSEDENYQEHEAENDQEHEAGNVCINDIDVASDFSVEDGVQCEEFLESMEEHIGGGVDIPEDDQSEYRCRSVSSEEVVSAPRSVSSTSDREAVSDVLETERGAYPTNTAEEPPETTGRVSSPVLNDLEDLWESAPSPPPAPSSARTTVIPPFFPPSIDFQQKMQALKRNIACSSAAIDQRQPLAATVANSDRSVTTRDVSDQEAQRLARIFGVRRGPL